MATLVLSSFQVIPIARRLLPDLLRLYEYHWAIKTTFENMKRDLHLDEFVMSGDPTSRPTVMGKGLTLA